MQDDNVVIQPADPQTVYVPAYNPTEVYGQWPYRSYQPVYIPPAPAYQDAIVFQKDLGPNTATTAAATKLFDPDLSWARVDVVD